jgi:hypothetical protein
LEGSAAGQTNSIVDGFVITVTVSLLDGLAEGEIGYAPDVPISVEIEVSFPADLITQIIIPASVTEEVIFTSRLSSTVVMPASLIQEIIIPSQPTAEASIPQALESAVEFPKE